MNPTKSDDFAGTPRLDLRGEGPATPVETLRDVFGLPGFRPGQAEVVDAQLAGRDVLSVAPTGSGKSISYWVPAVLDTGLTLVVSPLIALMKDQVDRLRSHGVAAGFVNSSIDRSLQVRCLEEAERGELRLLYLAPERLSRPGFLERLARLRVSRVVVDEAHCISTWGHDFRPDYRLIGRAIDACGRPPIAAFTATATPRVRADVAATLALRDPFVLVTGFHRPNLRLEVAPCRGANGKLEELRRRLDPGDGRALVYAGTIAAAEEVAEEVRRLGFPAAAYHGKLGDQERHLVQEHFAAGLLRVVVATSAFGMGVDLPDIRQVIHFHLPGSLEAYYQEAGRAGRDGLPARCLLLFSAQDRDLQTFFIEQSESSPELKEHAYARLAQAIAYAHLTTCRHARIADYFGEQGVARTCDNCDNCLSGAGPGELVAPGDVRAALAGLARLDGHVGAANLAAVLGGRSTTWTRRNLWITEQPVYGSLGGWSEERLRELLRQLVEAGLASQSHGEYPVLALTRDGRRALRSEIEPEVRVRDEKKAPPRAAGRWRAAPEGPAAPADARLVERLRRWRAAVARDGNVPAYVVFHDRTLIEIAARRPITPDELSRVSGVGPTKLERYGAALLEVLAEA